MVQLSSQNVKHGCLSDEEYCLRFYIGSFSPPPFDYFIVIHPRIARKAKLKFYSCE